MRREKWCPLYRVLAGASLAQWKSPAHISENATQAAPHSLQGFHNPLGSILHIVGNASGRIFGVVSSRAWSNLWACIHKDFTTALCTASANPLSPGLSHAPSHLTCVLFSIAGGSLMHPCICCSLNRNYIPSLHRRMPLRAVARFTSTNVCLQRIATMRHPKNATWHVP